MLKDHKKEETRPKESQKELSEELKAKKLNRKEAEQSSVQQKQEKILKQMSKKTK